ncbi:MAG: helix-turn-helix domain-containing protein [Elusimicrobia bacterium]|nr:helix-turn-helix domain-containing protein [Elusimicrobiota bacterium]
MKSSDLTVSIGKGIRAYRKRLKLTIEQLAEAAGIDSNYLAHLETGSKTPSLPTVAKIIDALDIAPAALFAGAHSGTRHSSDGDDLERKIRVLVRGLDRNQRLDLLAVLPRLRAGQIKGLRRLLRA